MLALGVSSTPHSVFLNTTIMWIPGHLPLVHVRCTPKLKRQKVTKTAPTFCHVLPYNSVLLTLTKIDKNLTLSHRFFRIRQKVTKQSLRSQATINNK